MKRLFGLIATVGCLGLALHAANAVAEEGTTAAATGAGMEKCAAMPCVYVCPACHMMAMKAGDCPMCQKKMAKMHVLGVKDGKASVCACGAACKCDAAGMKDGKCSCGKEVQEVSVKGMYVCPCSGGTCCSSISDKPGKCACGHEMKKAE